MAFPGRVVSLSVPALDKERYSYATQRPTLLNYFQRQVYDPGLWNSRVLTIYGSGQLHHCTYALTRFAIERRGLHNFDWTYFHFDQHRDDWGRRSVNGLPYRLSCSSFVDILAHDHRAIPFMVGPDVYAKKDSRGYNISGTHIPIYNNQFPKSLQESRTWTSDSLLQGVTNARRLPSRRDLSETPTESYLSFDLDLLSPTEIVTDYDQNRDMTLRALLPILDRVREYKRIFSADILGFPDGANHPLSALTMVILARKLMGLSIRTLLAYHTHAKHRQAGQSVDLEDTDRESPIQEGELLEVLQWSH